MATQRAPNNAITDLKTGLVTPEWLSWLQSVADSIGSSSGGDGGGGSGGGTGGGSGGDVTIINDYGSGTANKIAKWLAPQTLGDSIITESGTIISVAGTITAVSIAGPINVGQLQPTVPNAFLITNGASTPLFSSTVPFGLVPAGSGLYDVGRADRVWAECYLGQQNSLKFALLTQTALGGYTIVAKAAGNFAAGVTAADTTIDFGQAITPNDFVVVRAHDTSDVVQTEHLQVLTLVSGTRYNVLRDLDATGVPPTWAAGVPFAVLGTTGDNRIEIRAANGNPAMVWTRQGATFDTESVYGVIGNLNGYYGIPIDEYGFAFGDIATGPFLAMAFGSLAMIGPFDILGDFTIDGDVTVSGTVTAALFVGSGAGLTDLPTGGTFVEWSVLTNGDPVNPELIFADGDVIMVHTP